MSEDYRKGAEPGTHQVLFVEYDTVTRIAYKSLFSSRDLRKVRHIFCNICWLLAGYDCLGLSSTWSARQVILWFLSCLDFVLCFSLQVVFNLNFFFPVDIMLESYKNMSIYQFAALFLNYFLYETIRFVIENLCRSTFVDRNRYAKRLLWTTYIKGEQAIYTNQ